MRNIKFALIVLAATMGVAAQQGPDSVLPSAAGDGTTLSGVANLPVGRIGDNDLLGVKVYDAPPLTGPVRVSQEGDIRLPMVKEPIHAAGLYPQDLESVIAAVLVKDHLLVNPIVTVTIMEYESRPITVVGAVNSPLTFQAVGTVTLLDAISRAHGLANDAGTEILINLPNAKRTGENSPLVQRVSVSDLFDNTNPASNVELHGGDVVRVPLAGRVFVVGDVKSPCSYPITESSESSIMKALAFSGGLGQHPGHVAYIYRKEGGGGERNVIPVQLKKIMNRRSPDVALNADDILYIPEANGRRISMKVLEGMVGAATALGATLLYIYQ